MEDIRNVKFNNAQSAYTHPVGTVWEAAQKQNFKFDFICILCWKKRQTLRRASLL